MNKIVFKKELAELLGQRRFLLLTLLFYALFIFCAINAYHYTVSHQDEAIMAQQQSYRQWLEQGEKNPHSAAHYGYYAFKPTAAGSMYDNGLNEYLGRFVYIEAHHQNEVKFPEVKDMYGVSRVNGITNGMLFSFLLPLIILLLGFDAVSREYEAGTMRILFSTGLSKRQWLWTKYFVLFTASLIIALPPLLFQSVLIANNTPDTISSLLLLVLGLLILYAIVAAICLNVAVWLKNRNTVLITLLLAWAAGVYVIPQLSGFAAEQLHATPTSFAFTSMIRKDQELGLDGNTNREKRMKALQERMLSQYHVDSIAAVPLNWTGIELQAGEEYDAKIFDKHYGALFRRFTEQNETVNTLSLLSPMFLSRDLGMLLSGTDIRHHIHFTKQVETLRRDIQKQLNDDLAKGGAGLDFGAYKRGKELWQQIPEYKYTAPTAGKLISWAVPGFSALLIWLLITLLLIDRSHRALKI